MVWVTIGVEDAWRTCGGGVVCMTDRWGWWPRQAVHLFFALCITTHQQPPASRQHIDLCSMRWIRLFRILLLLLFIVAWVNAALRAVVRVVEPRPANPHLPLAISVNLRPAHHRIPGLLRHWNIRIPRQLQRTSLLSPADRSRSRLPSRTWPS